MQKTAAPRELTAAGADGALAARSCARLRRRRGCRASGTRRRTRAPTWCTTSRRRAGRRADSTPFDRSRQAAPAQPSLRAAARAVWVARRATRRLQCTARSAAAAPAVTAAPRAGGRRAGSRRAGACGRSRAPARRRVALRAAPARWRARRQPGRRAGRRGPRRGPGRAGRRPLCHRRSRGGAALLVVRARRGREPPLHTRAGELVWGHRLSRTYSKLCVLALVERMRA